MSSLKWPGRREAILPEPTLACTSLVAIVLSAIVSIPIAWITSRRSIAVERAKTLFAAEQRHLEILIRARLKEYPGLYSLLSDIPKAFDLCPTATLDPPRLLKQVNHWNSQHAILMSRDASNYCYAFRAALVEVVHQGRVPSKTDHFHDLRKHAERLELALRSDLGIEAFRLSISFHSRARVPTSKNFGDLYLPMTRKKFPHPKPKARSETSGPLPIRPNNCIRRWPNAPKLVLLRGSGDIRNNSKA